MTKTPWIKYVRSEYKSTEDGLFHMSVCVSLCVCVRDRKTVTNCNVIVDLWSNRGRRGKYNGHSTHILSSLTSHCRESERERGNLLKREGEWVIERERDRDRG